MDVTLVNECVFDDNGNNNGFVMLFFFCNFICIIIALTSINEYNKG